MTLIADWMTAVEYFVQAEERFVLGDHRALDELTGFDLGVLASSFLSDF
jgi:hypothetical protein